MAAATKKSLETQAKKIIKAAKDYGADQNFFFVTTFERYQVQMRILNDLEETIEKDGTLVDKEYVKGRKNVYTHPAIGEYNKTATAANNTITTLLKILQSFTDQKGSQPKNDKLTDFLDAIQKRKKES